jgi:eukaryotic-like serine/threonine-protein kinase
MGAILYFMLTGKPWVETSAAAGPLGADSPERLRPGSFANTGVPADLQAVVLRCLAKSPSDRWPDAQAVADALGACACAAEWDDSRARQWWLEQADKPLPAASGDRHEAVGSRVNDGREIVAK